jgi:hypothetical protein
MFFSSIPKIFGYEKVIVFYLCMERIRGNVENRLSTLEIMEISKRFILVLQDE